MNQMNTTMIALGLIAIIIIIRSLTALPLSYAQMTSSSSSQPTQQSTTATPQAGSAPTTSGSQSILPSSSSSPSSQSEGRAQTENFPIDSVLYYLT
jgi:hypothetical protein